MLPSIISSELEQAAKDSISTSFNPTTDGFRNLIDRFLSKRENLFKGPYVSLSLPFKQGGGKNWFPEIPLSFPPYSHQEKSFSRLSPGSPENTLIATGTGSGKTECFLLPVLEHCRQDKIKGQRGIKAIIIYPMNALATDQARRIARKISETSSISNLRVGLYIGSDNEIANTSMTPDSVITNKEALHKYPPDILLTNYKQLDYLLIQPHVKELWRDNAKDTLRYLVVDEFHTFDGAQGTDLACLIRRLRSRLNCLGDKLVCVGTSATLGDDDSSDQMLDYASQVFSSSFDISSLIREERISTEDFFNKYTAFGDKDNGGFFSLPLPSLRNDFELNPRNYQSLDEYLIKQAKIWLGDTLPPPQSNDINNMEWRVELGLRLGTLPAIHNLVRQAKDTCSIENLLARFSRQLGLGEKFPIEFRLNLLASLLALISHARRMVKLQNSKKVIVAWIDFRQQLWLRELKRMVASVEAEPELRHSDDLSDCENVPYLPVVNCRDCGATAWSSTITNQGSNQLDSVRRLKDFYRAFFDGDPYLRFIFPTKTKKESHKILCTECLSFHQEKDIENNNCPNCLGKNLINVSIPNCTRQNQDGNQYVSRDCPCCNSKNSLLLIGSSAANLGTTWSASLFASIFNSDRKLLTFSDSVQDAAHRAGFIAARAYRTSFRTALTNFVNINGSQRLDQFHENFINYWKIQYNNPLDFVATFIPYDLEWLEEWIAVQKNNNPIIDSQSFLYSIVKRRINWEILSEFGYRSQLGSTVEKAGTLFAEIDPIAVKDLIPNLLFKLQNEIECLRNLEANELSKFIIGILFHLRQKGSLDINELTGSEERPSDYLLTGGENTFTFNKIRHTPNFGTKSIKPIFLTNFRKKGIFEQLINEIGPKSWYQLWLNRTLLFKQEINNDLEREILQISLEELVNSKILREIKLKSGVRVWAISLTKIIVSKNPSIFKCGCCGSSVSVPSNQEKLFEKMSCFNNQCDGFFSKDTKNGLLLFNNLYQYGKVNRIVAKEHTGLLSRLERELLESQFIRGKYKSDPNLISATSTLEMGINIGDLSAVFLTSVPPEPSNYLQRIGRAGRKDGNAFIGTLVNSRSHDLYFFSDPDFMLRGKISPPGCYLDASSILRRQILAFSLDCWVISGISPNSLPRKIKPVLDVLEDSQINLNQSDSFPFNWLRWTENKQGQLFEEFLNMFQNTLADSTVGELRNWFKNNTDGPYGSQFSRELIERFEELIVERKRLANESRRLREKYNKLCQLDKSLSKQQLSDKEMIYREQRSYASLRKELENKPLLSLLTDEGFLPNYSFPESGVTLKSVLWRRKNLSDNSIDSSEDLPPITYERPANLAIRELVPNGQFYAQGRRVTVDQVDPNLNQTEKWRFCPSCSYSCRSTDREFNFNECPVCKTNGYADQGQIKEIIKLRHVQATTEDRKSRFGDDNDERNTNFFLREFFIIPDFKRREISLVFADDEFPFGVEYIASSVFREVNFGKVGNIGISHNIAGKVLRVRGFDICSSCGKVQNQNISNSNNHTWTCKYRDKPEEARSQNFKFIYREFKSQSIRFLLPTNEFWDNTGKASFVAALHLGLKECFGGKVEHLHSSLCEEPQIGSSQSKTFLYLYDSVPGGTGYVRQLMELEGRDLLKVFKKSLAFLKKCDCSNGCYKCIFQYRQRYDHENISKRRSINQLENIINRWKTLNVSDNSLSEIIINSKIESELELRFLEKLRLGKGVPEGITVSLRDDVINGKGRGYLLIFNNGKESISWKVELQVEISEREGVDTFARADFLLTPTFGGKSVAIFTDGWEFHKDRLAKDAEQRMALQRSNKYIFWSLNWDDIVEKLPSSQNPLSPNGLNKIHPGLLVQQKPFDEWWPNQLADSIKKEILKNIPTISKLQSASSFELLMIYLINPREEWWHGLAQLFSLAQVSEKDLNAPEFKKYIQTFNIQNHIEEWGIPKTKECFGEEITITSGFSIFNLANLRKHKSQEPSSSFRVLNFDPSEFIDEKFKQNCWREWLRQANIFQFLPHFFMFTKGWTGKEQSIFIGPYSEKVSNKLKLINEKSQNLEELEELEKLINPNCQSFFAKLKKEILKNSLPIPEIGFELTNSNGEVLAESEFAWPDRKIAVSINVEDNNLFLNKGWQVFLMDDSISKIVKLLIKEK